MPIIPSFLLSVGLLFYSPQLQTSIYTNCNTEAISTPNWSIIEKPFPWLEIDCGTITLNGVAKRTTPSTPTTSLVKFSVPTTASCYIGFPKGDTTKDKPIAFATTFKLTPLSITFFAQILDENTSCVNNCNFCTAFYLPLTYKIHKIVFATAIQNYVLTKTDSDSWYLPFELYTTGRYTAISAESSYKITFSSNRSGSSYFQVYLGGSIAEQTNTNLKGFYNIKTLINSPFGGLSMSFFCCDFGYRGPDETAQTKTMFFSAQPQIILPLRQDYNTLKNNDSVSLSACTDIYYKQPTNAIIEDGSINSTLATAMTKNCTFTAFSATAKVKKSESSLTLFADIQDLAFVSNKSLLITEDTTTSAYIKTNTKLSNMKIVTTISASVEPQSLLKVLSNNYKIELYFKHLTIRANSTIKDSKVTSWEAEGSLNTVAGINLEATLINGNKLKIVAKYIVKLVKTSHPLAQHPFLK
jgi:hypothetical protein